MKIERTPIDAEPPRKDIVDALNQVLMAPHGKSRSENRQPTKKTLMQKFVLVRRRAKPAQ